MIITLMMDIKNIIKHYISKLFQTGFFHIVGAGTINKALLTLLGLVIVRFLSKADYGIYAYANSIITIVVAFNGLGVVSAILQVCSELSDNRFEANKVFFYGYKWGIIVDVCFGICIALIALFLPLAISGSNTLLAIYSFYPLVILLCEIKQTQLRVTFQNKAYAYSTNLQTILLLALSVLGAMTLGATGLILGQELAYFLTYVFLCIKHHVVRDKTTSPLSKKDRVDLWKIALISTFNSGLGFALTLSGTQMIGIMTSNDELVATYQVSTLIPFGLLFVPGAIATYVYPYFAKNRNDRLWSISNYKKVLTGCVAISTLITITVCALAEPICVVIFGDDYLDAALPLRVLMIGFWLTGSFRQITGNLLVTQRKLIFNSIIGVASVVVCLGVGIWLIPYYGVVGAALSYDAAMLVGAIANTVAYGKTLAKLK